MTNQGRSVSFESLFVGRSQRVQAEGIACGHCCHNKNQKWENQDQLSFCSSTFSLLVKLRRVCPNRNKQMMGLGSLFGEGDLQHLDGDPVKERQVVDRQVTALWEIL